MWQPSISVSIWYPTKTVAQTAKCRQFLAIVLLPYCRAGTLQGGGFTLDQLGPLDFGFLLLSSSPSLHGSEGRVAAYVPPAAKRAECAHGGAGCIRLGALHVISCNKELTIRVQNVGQRNCTRLVGPFRKIASSRKRGNFTLQVLQAHLRLRKFHQCVLDILRSSQGRLPILGKRFGIGAARLGDLGCDLSKIEKPPPQRSRPDGLERLAVKKRAPVDAVETKRSRKRNLRVVIRDRNANSL